MALEEARASLACGVTLDLLVDQVTTKQQRPVDAAHQASCAHCQAALVALREAWGELRCFARQPVAVPPGLSERIMTHVSALRSRWGDGAVLAGERGETRIGERVIARVARGAALAVPGVALASALGVIVDPASRDQVRLRLRLTITFGPAVDALADAVRAQVSQQVSAQTGTRVAGVDIAVEDLIAGA